MDLWWNGTFVGTLWVGKKTQNQEDSDLPLTNKENEYWLYEHEYW